MSSIKLLNLITLILGSLLICLFLVSFDDPNLEMGLAWSSAFAVLAATWWTLFAHYHLKLSPVKIYVPIGAAFLLLGNVAYFTLDDDEFEYALSAVGVFFLIEGVGAGIYFLIRFQAKSAQRPSVVDQFAEPGAPAFADPFDMTERPRWLQSVFVFLVIAGGIAILIITTWVIVASASLLVGAAIAADLLFVCLNGWAIYAFVRNRQGRQDELAQVLVGAVTAGVPLPEAVRSYLSDRPPRTRWRIALSIMACVILPFYTYTRIWIGWRRYDKLVEELADRLAYGQRLSQALRATPGVACREVRLAAAVGESTGKLGKCLANAERERWAAAWLELAPQVLYPLWILLVVMSLTVYMMIFIIPKYKKIFDEFGERMPLGTQAFIDFALFFDEYSLQMLLVKLFMLILVAIVVADPAVRWHLPVFGRFYRWSVQAIVLRTLGRLLAAGQTAPQALQFLSNTRELPTIVLDRLSVARMAVGRGESLDDALESAELLPANMSPLVRASERVRALPWTLIELGDHLSGRAFRMMSRIVQVVAPLLVVAVGAVVAFIALALFLPLIHLITRLAI